MMKRVVTKGSVFLIDDALGRYMRVPKEERPRENGWGDDTQGPLQDNVWHQIDPEGWGIQPNGRLVIHVAGTFISAPDAEEQP